MHYLASNTTFLNDFSCTRQQWDPENTERRRKNIQSTSWKKLKGKGPRDKYLKKSPDIDKLIKQREQNKIRQAKYRERKKNLVLDFKYSS